MIVHLVKVGGFVRRDVKFLIVPHLLSISPEGVLDVVLHPFGFNILDEIYVLAFEVFEAVDGGGRLKENVR